MYYVYILRCIDNSLYTGITKDINRRMDEHFNKTIKCAKYTYNHTAVKLEAYWRTSNRVLASKLEFHIKTLSKKQKEELIIFNNLKNLLNNKIDYQLYERMEIKND